MLTFGSLFAGIGGMDLGLERAGLRCRWQVEINSHARRILAKHWPDVTRWDDVRTFPPDLSDPEREAIRDQGRSSDAPETRREAKGREERERIRTDARDAYLRSGGWGVDLIAGGFPSQDISIAGQGAGLAGERSGLWYEFARIVGILRPRYVLIENVAALSARGLDSVLWTLATLGYDAEWNCLQAADLGAPHLRDRCFIVAHTESGGLGELRSPSRSPGHALRGSPDSPNPDSGGRERIGIQEHPGEQRSPGTESFGLRPRGRGEGAESREIRDANSVDCEGRNTAGLEGKTGSPLGCHEASHPERDGLEGILPSWTEKRATLRLHRERCKRDFWGADPAEIESGVGGMVDGIPPRMDGTGGHGYTPRTVVHYRGRRERLEGLGNAVVPQVAEYLGTLIMEAERRRTSK